MVVYVVLAAVDMGEYRDNLLVRLSSRYPEEVGRYKVEVLDVPLQPLIKLLDT
jgi:hypothetical protein